MDGSVLLDPWCSWCSSVVPSPRDKQWQSNHREWSSRQAGDRTECGGRRIDTLGVVTAVEPLDRPVRAPGHATCGSRSPTAATSAAPTACPRRAWTGCPATELLTYEEQARIARVCVERFGFESIRITGGEPTVRAHLPRLIEHARAARRRPRHDHQRRASSPSWPTTSPPPGLRRVNVSLDSLRPETFLALTRRDELDRVLAGIDAALDAGLDPVKVNCVVMRGVNDDEVVDLAAFGRDKGVGVRFIEFMPLDARRASGRMRPGRARRRRSSSGSTPCSRSSASRCAGRRGTSSRPSGSATPTASATSA